MAEYEMLVCDHCGKEVKRHDALNWLRIGIVGIDARIAEDELMTGDFCSRKCLVMTFDSQDSGRRSRILHFGNPHP